MSTASIAEELPAQEQKEPHTLEQLLGPHPDLPIVRAKQKWNDPSINKWRLLVTFVSFAVIGASSGVNGALLPYIREDYSLSTTVVSLMFMPSCVGYAIATILANKVHMTMGQRGIAIIGPLLHLIAYIVLVVRPPYPVMLVVYAVAGLGIGLLEAAWSAWVADMVNANTLSGLLNAFFGLGATLSPIIATTMIKSGLHWNIFYSTMVGAAALELVAAVILFWQENGEKYRINNPPSPNADPGSRTMQAAKHHVTWLIALFLFIYLGAEISISGWIFEFMVKVRHGGSYESGFMPTGFWAGVTVGRLVLGFLTDFLGERIAIAGYLTICIVLELIFWLVPNFVFSAVAVALIGFFSGPLWPGAIVMAAKLLPKHLHTPAIGLASSLAGSGGAILPFVAGAISGARGAQSLQPFILALFVALLVLWLLLPRTKLDDPED